jgi:uncharacterized protein (TIGR03083 family)
MPVEVDFEDALDRFSALGRRFTVLVEAIKQPHRLTHELDWTLAETAVHVWQGLTYYASCLAGEVSFEADRAPGESYPSYFARENQRQLDAEPERDPAAISRRIEGAVDDLVAVARSVGPGAIATYPVGYSEESTAAVCTLILEMIVHGYDIARTIGARWRVERETSVLAVYSTAAALSLALDEKKAAHTKVHMKIRPRGGRPFSIRIERGRVWSEAASDDKPDVVVSADPLAYLLVGCGRSGLASQIVRGRILAWGRRPWVALRAPSMFIDP